MGKQKTCHSCLAIGINNAQRYGNLSTHIPSFVEGFNEFPMLPILDTQIRTHSQNTQTYTHVPDMAPRARLPPYSPVPYPQSGVFTFGDGAGEDLGAVGAERSHSGWMLLHPPLGAEPTVPLWDVCMLSVRLARLLLLLLLRSSCNPSASPGSWLIHRQLALALYPLLLSKCLLMFIFFFSSVSPSFTIS